MNERDGSCRYLVCQDFFSRLRDGGLAAVGPVGAVAVPPPGALRLERAGPVLYFAHGVTIGPYLDGTAACSINARPLASPRKRSG